MSDNSAERIGGWLLGPLAWLLVQLLSITITLVKFGYVLLNPHTLALVKEMGGSNTLFLGLSFLSFIAMWYYTLWLVIAFFKRRHSVIKHSIIWLLVSLLLALKVFAFSEISDMLAVRQLLFALLAAALFVPYFKRSQRVKATFVNP